MARKGTLTIEDKEYVLLNFSMKITREYDHRGRPSTMPKVGLLTMEVESIGDHFLAAWALVPSTTKSGQMKFYKTDEDSTLKTYDFEDAYVMDFEEIYDNYNTLNMSIKITIFCNTIELQPGGIFHDNNWHS